MKLYSINYTINLCEKYVGIAMVSACSINDAKQIFIQDSAFNGYRDKLKITKIQEEDSDRCIQGINVEDYMRSHAIEVLQLNNIIVADGKSAYELAVEQGFKGTLQEWLKSLQGKDGKDGLSGNINYPTFRINSGMYLIMKADAASDEDRFKLSDNGNLILII